jgi:hypothetical protein
LIPLTDGYQDENLCNNNSKIIHLYESALKYNKNILQLYRIEWKDKVKNLNICNIIDNCIKFYIIICLNCQIIVIH